MVRLVTLLILALASTICAADSQYHYDTKLDSGARWVQGHDIKVHTSRGDAEAQIYYRVIRHHSKIFSVGSVMYQKLPIISTETEDDFISKVTEELRTGLKIPNWHRKLVKNAVVWETNWGEGHQYIRLYIKRNPKSIEYAMATFRDTYAERTGLESEVIQMETLGLIPNGLKNPKSRTADLMKFFFSNDAEAQATDPVTGTPIKSTGSSFLTGIIPGGGIPGIPGLPTTLPSLPTAGHGSVPTLNGNLNVSGNVNVTGIPTNFTVNVPQAAALSTNVNNLVGSVDKIDTNLTAQMTQLNKNAAAGVAQAARFNDLVARSEQMASDGFKGGNIFKDAFLTGAGGALGIAAVDLAVSGVRKLVVTIVDKLGHESRETEFNRVRMVQDAIDQYRNFSDEVIDYTRMIDAAAAILHNQTGFLKENFNSDNIEEGILQLQDALETKIDQIETSRKTGGNAEERYNMRRDAANMAKVIDMLKNSSSFCGSLHELFNQMEEAEDKIQDLSIQTLTDISKYYKSQKDFNQYIVEQARKENTDAALKKEAAAQKALLQADDKAGNEEFKDHYKKLMSDCEKIFNGYRNKQMPHVSKDTIKAECESYFKQVSVQASRPDGRDLFEGVRVAGFSEDNAKQANEELQIKYNFTKSVFDIYIKQNAVNPPALSKTAAPDAFATENTEDSATAYFNKLIRSQGSFGADIATMKKEDERRSLIISQMRANQAAVTTTSGEIVAYENPDYKNLREMIEGGKVKVQEACKQLNRKSAPAKGQEVVK